MSTRKKDENRINRHRRGRKRVVGTEERPRLAVSRSHLNLSFQVIDDYAERTLVSSSTSAPDYRAKDKSKARNYGNVESAKHFGRFAAETLRKKKIEKIVFDRGGRLYQGRVKAFAEALRESGIQF